MALKNLTYLKTVVMGVMNDFAGKITREALIGGTRIKLVSHGHLLKPDLVDAAIAEMVSDCILEASGEYYSYVPGFMQEFAKKGA